MTRKNKYTGYLLTITCFLTIGAAIYFHNGYFNLVNEYIYSDAAIPAEFKQDTLYFMNKKLAFKNRTICGIFIFSLILLFSNRKIYDKWLKILLFIQFLVVFFSLFLWIVRPIGIIVY